MDGEEKKEFSLELRRLAVPLALQSFLGALVGASDALMLGRLNQDAIAAVSLANQVSFVMSLFDGAIIGSAGVLAAQYWGKGDRRGARRFLGLGMRYAAGISAVFFLLTFFFPEGIMRFFTAEPELIRTGGEYLRIVCFSYLFTGISQCFFMIMKVSGHARMSVRISAVTVAVDMAADFFLIYGVGPFPALGARGSAISTVVVEALALLWCAAWALRRPEVRPRREELIHIFPEDERDAWRVIPGMLASSLSWGLSMTAQSFILGHLGTDATAAASVVTVAKQLIRCLTQGLANGAGIMLGRLLGQNQLEKAKEYGERFWRVTFYCGLANVALMGAVGPLVYFFYVLEPQAKSYLVRMLAFNAVYMFAFSYNTIITSAVFPAGGDSKYDAISVFFATWCFSIPLALLGCFALHLPVMAVYCVMCLDEIVKAPFIRRRYNRYLWLRNLTREETAE